MILHAAYTDSEIQCTPAPSRLGSAWSCRSSRSRRSPHQEKKKVVRDPSQANPSQAKTLTQATTKKGARRPTNTHEKTNSIHLIISEIWVFLLHAQRSAPASRRLPKRNPRSIRCRFRCGCSDSCSCLWPSHRPTHHSRLHRCSRGRGRGRRRGPLNRVGGRVLLFGHAGRALCLRLGVLFLRDVLQPAMQAEKRRQEKRRKG